MRKIIGSVVLGLAIINNAGAVKVTSIKYIGCERIEKETISTYFPIQIGDECGTETINEALKALKETNFFSDVKVRMSGSTVIVEVKESPIINKISFEGNSKLSDSDIKKAIKLGSHEPLSPAKVKEVQQALLQIYRKMGRYNATVKPKIIKLKENRVNLVYEIKEGVAAGISKIIFIGNDKIKSSDLRDVIHSKVKKWFRFFVTDDIYDADRLEEDKMIIEKYYHEQGYMDARVLSATAELAPNKSSFVLTFTIDEGNLYTFDSISVKSHLAKVTEQGLEKDLYCRKGDVYSASFIEADASRIARMVGQRGFPTVSVTPKITRNLAKNTVGVVFNITEGEKIYVSKIVISGNTKTRDHVIRREIVLQEGDAYNQSFVRMSESKIKDLGFFDKVDIQAIPDPNSPDKCILHVTVTEAPTAEAMANAAYSTTSGLGFDLQYNEQNFFGTGKTLSVFLGSSRTTSGKSRITKEDGSTGKDNSKAKFRFLNNVQVSVTDPHIFDKDMEGSVSFHRNVSSIFDGFNSNELGVGFGLSYELSRHWEQSWGYTLDRRKFQDVSKTASPIILAQVQKRDGDKVSTKSATNILSELRHTIAYNTYFIRGLKGSMSVSLATSIAGFGGNARHIKNVLTGVYVMPVFRRTKLSFSLSTGMINKLGGKDPNIMDSFIYGADSFRGFEYAGVGPIASTLTQTNEKQIAAVIASNAAIPPGGAGPLLPVPAPAYRSQKDFLGAKKFWKGTIEYTFPLGLPEELQFRGFIFTDIGSLWSAPNKKNKYIEEQAGQPAIADSAKLEHDPIAFKMDESHVKGQKIFDKSKIRQSIGLGISFVTPFGPIKLTYAKPIQKGKYDEQQRFLLGFQSSF